jgi:YidC/Oxa1 family membrane protein insertase
MAEFFHTLLYQPIFNLFVFLYDIVGHVAIVIVLMTLLLKLVLYPFTASSIKAQQSLREIQPKLNALKEKYKEDQQQLAQETMKLYKENKVNPLGSCLPVLVQIPFFLALYWVLRNGLTTNDFSSLYSFVPNPGEINAVDFGVNFAVPSILFAVLAGGSQFFYAKFMITTPAPKQAGSGAADENMLAAMNKNMMYVMPLITFMVSFQLPGGLALYWFISTIFSAAQHLYLKKKHATPASTTDVIEGTVVSDN